MNDTRRTLLVVLAAGIAASAAACAARSGDDGAGTPAPERSGASRPGLAGHVGSDACAPCHAKEFSDWKATLHSRMEQAATPETVRGTWSEEGTVVPVEAEGKRIVMVRRGDSYWVEAPDADGIQRLWPVERTVGNRYKQRYVTKFPDGSWRTLPVQWFEKDGKFVEWHHMASAEPGSGGFWADAQWQWQLKCAGCHTTGLDLGWDAAARTYDTAWSELAIGCEACHGPGEAHVAARGGVDNIVCASRLPFQRQLDACGKCHSRGTAGPEQGAPAGLPGRLAYPWNMVPGERLADRYVQFTPESKPAEFWRDGSSRNHHQQWNDYELSGMVEHGGRFAPHCTSCHDPHRADALTAPIEDNTLCLKCHEALRDAESLSRHTGHGSDAVRNPGARCVECHMPRIVDHAGSFKLRSHTYWDPNPARAKETGTPDACLLCHTDRDAAWSAAAAARIWAR